MSVGNKDVFAKNLKKYILKSGKDRSIVAEETGFPYSTLTDWVNGKKYPRINNIEKLAIYFNVSKSDLIEDFEEIKKDNDRLVSIIVKLRTNKELVDVVERLISLDKAKLESLSRLLDTFV
ncbi:MAG: helix-turn-helix transcriptional regulator [Ruminococcus sp.]|nr:helix-turn-helix transcriptional regulator [Ruminococcus sp.]